MRCSSKSGTFRRSNELFGIKAYQILSQFHLFHVNNTFCSHNYGIHTRPVCWLSKQVFAHTQAPLLTMCVDDEDTFPVRTIDRLIVGKVKMPI